MSLTHLIHLILVPGADGRVVGKESVDVQTSGIIIHPITSSHSRGIPSIPPIVICRDFPSDPVHRTIPQTDNKTAQL
jgi:hypothetical protein